MLTWYSTADAIHPNILPAGKLWADVILRKLRVHVGDS